MVEADIDVPKGQAKQCSASYLLLLLHLWLPPEVFFAIAIEGTSLQTTYSSHATTTGSRTSIDLQVVFFVSF